MPYVTVAKAEAFCAASPAEEPQKIVGFAGGAEELAVVHETLREPCWGPKAM